MTTTFTDQLKQRFAGELSENETVLCSSMKELFEAVLNGRSNFEAAAVLFWTELRTLRKFNYDVEVAFASGEFDPTLRKILKSDQSAQAILSPSERGFCEDTLGLIDWVVRNGVNFNLVLEVLGHDIGELSNHEFSLAKTLADFVVPKVSGWAKRNSEPIGESIEQD